MNTWLKKALYRIEADYQRSSDTHLVRVGLPQAGKVVRLRADRTIGVRRTRRP